MSETASKVEQAKALIEGGHSQRAAAKLVHIAQSTLSEALKRESYEPPEVGPQKAGVIDVGDEVIITDKPHRTAAARTAGEDKAEALLRQRGYDPTLYVVDKVVTSEWGDPDAPLFQDKVHARRRDAMVVLPDFKDFEGFPFGQTSEVCERRVALIPDLHAPFCNWRAIGAVLDLLRAEMPEQIVFLGDAGDHTNLSKHRTHPRFAAKLNETNQSVATLLRWFREAVPRARMDFIPGNHDDRILYYSREVGGELAGVKPPVVFPEEDEEQESLSYRRLYGLDKLGINLVEEDWQLADIQITSELTAQHGYLTGNNSEKKMLEKEGRSQVHGHTHHGSVVYRTKHNPLDVRVVMDCGTLSEVKKDGLGYAPKPDWTPGIGWAHIWEDDMFQLSFIPFVKDKLLTPWGVSFDGREVPDAV